MWFQWHPSVLVAPVVFQCVPIMQINTGSPLEHHWVLLSASAVPVASQCTCGSNGVPVWSVQWYPSVLTESGLEVIRSVHYPACDPYVYNWYGVSCLNSTDFMWLATPNTQKLWWCSYQRHAQNDVEVLTCVEQNWYPLQSCKFQVKAEYTETCSLAYWCLAILSFQTGMDATLHA